MPELPTGKRCGEWASPNTKKGQGSFLEDKELGALLKPGLPINGAHAQSRNKTHRSHLGVLHGEVLWGRPQLAVMGDFRSCGELLVTCIVTCTLQSCKK